MTSSIASFQSDDAAIEILGMPSSAPFQVGNITVPFDATDTGASSDHTVADMSNSVTGFQLRLFHLINLLYYVAVVPLGLIGNAATVFVAVMLARSRLSTRKSVPDVCVGLLAVIDVLSIVCVQCPSLVVTLIAGGESGGGLKREGGPFGGARTLPTTTTTTAGAETARTQLLPAGLCSFEATAITVCIRLQLTVQVLAAIDRYAALTNPLRYHRVSTGRILRVIIAVSTTVLVATVGVSLAVDAGRTERLLVTWPSLCLFEWRTPSGVLSSIIYVVTAAAFVVAFGAFAGCNAALARILWLYNSRQADQAGILREISTAIEAVGGGNDGHGKNSRRHSHLTPELYAYNRQLPLNMPEVESEGVNHDDERAAGNHGAEGSAQSDLPIIVVEPPSSSFKATADNRSNADFSPILRRSFDEALLPSDQRSAAAFLSNSVDRSAFSQPVVTASAINGGSSSTPTTKKSVGFSRSIKDENCRSSSYDEVAIDSSKHRQQHSFPVRPRQLSVEPVYEERCRRRQKHRDTIAVATDRVAYVEHHLHKLLRKAERKSHRQRRQLYLIRLVVICAVVYVITWLPYAASNLLTVIGWSVSDVMYDIGLKLVLVNAALNPVTNALCRKNYRRGYRYVIHAVGYNLLCRLVDKPDDDSNLFDWRQKRKQQTLAVRYAAMSTTRDLVRGKWRLHHVAAGAAAKGAAAAAMQDAAGCQFPGAAVSPSQHAINLLQQTVQMRAVAALMNHVTSGSPSPGYVNKERDRDHRRHPQQTPEHQFLSTRTGIEFRPSKQLQDLFERCLHDTDSDSSSDESTFIDYDALVSPEAVDDLWKVWTSLYRTTRSPQSRDNDRADRGRHDPDADSIELDVNYDALIEPDD